ncbi:MAG: glycoside hydrolase family 9 protein [Hyphomicrobiaceae bacterium]|uniref:glycoside hydrolase family 9 protein n=1 Tax=Pseudorhodoplanes sp. TaxID=1934341 RepID=UPI003D0E2951
MLPGVPGDQEAAVRIGQRDQVELLRRSSIRRLCEKIVVIWLAIVGFAASTDGWTGACAKEAARSGSQGAAVQVESPLSLKFGLAIGPNGPIPAIVVDQFGYAPSAIKIAIARDPQVGYDAFTHFTPSRELALVDVATGEVVKAGAALPWNDGRTDQASGDRAWWFEFSTVTRPGRYVVVDAENGIRSPEFSIGDNIYDNVIKRALKMFFYQRAGARKAPSYAGAPWADGASHMGPGQDPFAKPWPGAKASFKPAQLAPRDLRGGWFDAGDYNKYTNWAARAILVLLQAYEENPAAFDDEAGIPESKNGIPDILDEVKWSLDWMARMQNPDGSVLCVQALASGSPPSAASGPSYFGPPTTSASLMAAAAFAYAAKLYRGLGRDDFTKYADDMAQRARAAWTWAVENPSVQYWNNDEARQPGSAGLAHGQQEFGKSDQALAKIEAAVNLYEITGDTALKQYAEAHYSELTGTDKLSMWQVDSQDAALKFSTIEALPQAVRQAARVPVLNRLDGMARAFSTTVRRSDPYRAPIANYTWGSNKAKAMQAREFQLAAKFAQDDDLRRAAKSAALNYLHYIHGANPLGLVYLTNMAGEGASQSANTMFHQWFAKDTRWGKVARGRPGPPPGYLVGGPNETFKLDSCCAGNPYIGCLGARVAAVCGQIYSPPLGQPPAKSYLQFNEGWPANSWEVSEPSIAYQSYYIRLLAAFVR